MEEEKYIMGFLPTPAVMVACADVNVAVFWADKSFGRLVVTFGLIIFICDAEVLRVKIKMVMVMWELEMRRRIISVIEMATKKDMWVAWTIG